MVSTMSQTTIPYVGFIAGTTITCKVNDNEQAVLVEELKPGMLVKTVSGAFYPVDKMGSRILTQPSHDQRIPNRLYVLSKSDYPSLTADLVMTGYGAILLSEGSDTDKRHMIEVYGIIRVADKRLCFPSIADSKASLSPTTGDVTIYNFSLKHKEKGREFGIYANGLEVASANLPHMSNPVYTVIQ